MSKEEPPTYLKDHLAGSVGALELLDHLIETYKGKPLAEFKPTPKAILLRGDISRRSTRVSRLCECGTRL
jgi:hypothetical protein